MSDALIDRKVVDFVRSQGSWNYDLFAHLLPSEVVTKMKAIKPPIPGGGVNNVIRWRNGSQGRFSAASAYQFITSNTRRWTSVYGKGSGHGEGLKE